MRRSLVPDDCKKLSSISITELEIEPLLRKMKNTSPGYDNIPCWVFKTCSYELAGVIAFIINYSIRSGVVPSNWLTAIVTPVLKVSNPKNLSDFRPISVTPVLSRITEKLIVRNWLRFALSEIDLSDQFAFRPTSSTNCALVYCLDYVAKMLETNSYVRCLCVDFAKAFDMVNHAIVIRKLNSLNLPDCIKNWVISFLTGRSQITRLANSYSSKLYINRSIVQGSGIGPSLYILMESDLHPLSDKNMIFKFADDTNLLVSERSDISMKDEFTNIQDWACRNKMVINLSKTKEIVFHRPHPGKFSLLPSIEEVEIVREVKLLGVILTDNFSFDKHVNSILATCSQRLYLLKLLRDCGMPIDKLNVVFCALIVNRLSYCISAWGGFANAEQIGRMNALLLRARKYRLTDNVYDFIGLMQHVDYNLFKSMQSEIHCLNQILPPERCDNQRLRTKGHNYCLPKCQFQLYKKSFLSRTLYALL